MKAVRQFIVGGDLSVISNEDIPVPKDREIQIRVKFSSLNRMDLLQAKGLYPVPHGASTIIGKFRL